ncbi:MAG: cyclic nucleotide-binding domain-containing protein [Bdellovibrionaceae bacterium]|nr:cyclic nucleotide-binding domain-containing protein [Bdellovibrionales bacterium]MCB9084143.1 cyclic nucleotide-binding domain-containing protein [Pseudobdellovibrionaceae bacterium]
MSQAAQKRETALDRKTIVESLLEFPFFKHFPEKLLEQVADHVEYYTYPQGASVLLQGQLNHDLYFLLSGKLGVYVDGGVVATLDKKGSLVGEMSVISRQPVGATIKAEAPVEMLVINANKFNTLEGTDSDGFQHALYRVYAHDLTEKLRVTNQKAKYFEDLTNKLTEAQEELKEINRDLEEKVRERTADLQKRTEDLVKSHAKLEQQNAELVASHKKLEELYSTRTLTFKKLEDLYKNFLVPLQMTLMQIEQQSSGGHQKEMVQSAIGEVNDVLELLEPVTSLYSTEQAMKSKRVLLAEPNKKQQITAKMALGGTGVELDIVSDLEEGKKLVAEHPVDIAFIPAEMLELVALAQKANPSCHFVFMTSAYIPEYLPVLKKHDFLPHIISRDENDRTFTIKNIVTSVAKLAGGDIFGLSKYLAWGVDIKSAPIIRSDERGKLIDQMDEYFSGLGIRSTIRERMRTVSEELLMNAIYDAPVDQDGKSMYNHISRNELVILDSAHIGRLQYATDGMLMAVSVSDPNGALSGLTILNYLEKCYGGAEGGHDEDASKGGAGRGIHQIIENADLTVFNIRPGSKTEVIALFNVDPKAQGDKHPSFHLFQE